MALGSRIMRGLAGAFAFALAAVQPVQAQTTNFEAVFDDTFGTEARAPRTFEAVYETGFERKIARLADGADGRIGVAVLDLATGEEFSILGNQRFPMASTSKIAIAATFMEGVEQGRWSLSSEFPLLIPVRSEPFSSAKAPVRPGKHLPARQLIELMITRSSNSATDALLAVVGGPDAVNDWMRRAGIEEFQLTRDIATLVRDDGEIDPARAIDMRDSATPRAMTELLAGLYKGRWLSDSSRELILGAMERCRTGTRRIPALLPANAFIAHKTGSLHNTSSDIGIVRTPDGQAFAVAIYVTGQGSRPAREKDIARIAQAVYSGYDNPQGVTWAQATYGAAETAALP